MKNSQVAPIPRSPEEIKGKQIALTHLLSFVKVHLLPLVQHYVAFHSLCPGMHCSRLYSHHHGCWARHQMK